MTAGDLFVHYYWNGNILFHNSWTP